MTIFEFLSPKRSKFFVAPPRSIFFILSLPQISATLRPCCYIALEAEKFAKLFRLLTFARQKKTTTTIWLAVVPLPRKFPSDAYAIAEGADRKCSVPHLFNHCTILSRHSEFGTEEKDKNQVI